MRRRRHIYLFLSFILFGVHFANASKLEKGFEALKVFDYFQAKKLLHEIHLKKPDAYASYGLALIFSRNDNPFSNLDSAGKYISLSFHLFLAKPETLVLSGFIIDKTSILNLSDTITQKMFRMVRQLNTVSAYNYFLQNFYVANPKWRDAALRARDELDFAANLEFNKSDSTKQFMLLHPESSLYKNASSLLEKQLYDEQTKIGTAEAYIAFLARYPKSPFVKTAHEKLFTIYRSQKDVAGLAFFVKTYPQSHQGIEAWKLLFSLSVKEFSFDELKNFVREYPDFPLKTSILHELELNKLVLYPYQKGDFSGFIDDKGQYVIKPVYDAASDFYEGLSVVSKNDSVYFINKKNVNPFGKIYSEASVFKNGIAPVKQNSKWYFINRQGQSISKNYDEINELSDGVYVVKSGEKYGALDQFGQTILEPKFDKLGDFKNDYAYYMDKGSYGFVSRTGTQHSAEFEWISDFNSSHIAIIKQNNKYGLINILGKKILEAEYDQIFKTNSSVFIVVQNNLYGFFSSEGCFLSALAYDYLKEKMPEYYTDGTLFKLQRKGEQSFVDANGRTYIAFGTYQEINFPENDLMRVKQKNKYGYLDKKLALAIPYKYLQAGDFSDSLALAKVKEYNTIITVYGSEVFSTGAEIVKISHHYFSVNDDSRSVINNKGELVFTEVDNVQKINNRLLIVTLNNGEIKLLYD